MSNISLDGYKYHTAASSHSHDYILPVVYRIIDSLKLSVDKHRVFELGCGNGAAAASLSNKGFEVVGIDPSEEGITISQREYPNIRLERGDCYSDLAGQFGQFPIVLSLEVVEHVFLPREYARRVYELLEEGGVAVISTPYHGYWKNLALALTGKMDAHFTALWDFGHIKFWSESTLRQLLEEAGFKSIQFMHVGRIRLLAKSMIAIAYK
ncbi:MAG: methyltransferase domain-containing protein [Methylovulum miyakonense]|uniref:class I SAM-dependent methyltransferase n=1 Tax=Methylovulum miyakonense TaxID=645578 RepID=UPI003BB7A4C5